MAKLQKPLNKPELWITQTYHGEKTKLPDTQCAVDISANVGNEVISVVDGVIEKVDVAGEYVSIIPDGGNFRILNVHINLIPVKMGQRVRVGQVIGHIAPNKGGSHLHFGLKWKNPAKPAPCPMDYFDRSIIFRTKYQAIKDIWFKGEDLDWSKFRDLSYIGFKIGDKVVFTDVQNIRKNSYIAPDNISGKTTVGQVGTIKDGVRVADGYNWFDIQFDGGGTGWIADVGKMEIYTPPVQPPVVPPETTECEKEVIRLQSEIDSLKASTALLDSKLRESQEERKRLEGLLEAEKIEFKELEERYKDLEEGKNRFEEEKNEAVKLLNEYKNGRFVWIVDFLEKLFPKKK